MNILLASTSPRRHELLSLVGVAFSIVPPTDEELLLPHLSPSDQTRQLARDKAQSMAETAEAISAEIQAAVEMQAKILAKRRNR